MPTQDRPNVLIIIMDDLAYGDLACHGNPYTQTPHLDALHDQSARLTRYCSGPLCTPARAALMTGRYPYRTRAIDTYCGRSMMDPGEVTLAELMRYAGYATGISGKWHLGDCYPMRAIDKGFDEALVHNGGGLFQPGNFGDFEYFDPELMHNGKLTKHKGYCTDIFTDHCIDFITQKRDHPWFCYFATNAPHTPIVVADEWRQCYLDMGLPEKEAGLYGMVDNIDMNIGCVLAALDQHGMRENTIVVYTSDHGPCGSASTNGEYRFNSNLRGGKGTMYEGGIRTPCFWRWPGKIQPGAMDRVVNPIDFLPTLANVCDFDVPVDRTVDGIDVMPLLTREHPADTWPDREVFMQWHRGDVPERFRNAATITQQYKWYHTDEGEQLFDVSADPYEQQDIIAGHPKVAAQLKTAYCQWFDDVSTEHSNDFEQNYMCPPIVVGTEHENPTVLTRQDGRLYPDGEEGWGTPYPVWWYIKVPEDTEFDLRIRIPDDLPGTSTLTLRWGNDEHETKVTPGSDYTFASHLLTAGTGKFEVTLHCNGDHLCVLNVWFYRR